MKNNFYIFRHGETFASRDKVPYGDRQYETEVLPEGIEPIKRLANYLSFTKTDFHYTSELIRCLQTSQIVTQITGKKFEQNSLLNEYLEDSFDQFRERVKKFVDQANQETNKTFLICTHGAVISALKHLIIFGEYEEHDLMDFPVPGTLMILNNTGSEIVDFNRKN